MNMTSRQSFLGENHEEVLAMQTVGIVGLCGGGSHIAQQLAHIGAGSFVIADFDFVEDTNLTRMVGSCPKDAEINEQKTTVIKRLINTIKPNTKVEVITDSWLSSYDMFQKCDVIFGCVDNYLERSNLESFCRKNSILYIDIGMDVHSTINGFLISGQIIVSKPDGVCMHCLGFLNDEIIAQEQNNYGAAGYKAQVIWPNATLASTAVAQYIASILPWSPDVKVPEMIHYDGNRHSLIVSSKLANLRAKGCPHYPGENNELD